MAPLETQADPPDPDGGVEPWQPPDGFDAFQEALVLSACPVGSSVVAASPYRPGYIQYPLRVQVRMPDGSERVCAIKTSPEVGGAQREGLLLPVLGRLGLTVPALLAGPVPHPDYPHAGALFVMSELAGQPLPWIHPTLEEADATCRLLLEAVAAMHALTEPLRRDPVAARLPEHTLMGELDGIVHKGGPWFGVDLFAGAVERLQPVLERIDTPLVFSNGDYNPLNFLWDGTWLTGWLDFTHACFEDPHIGFAKFTIWAYDSFGWGAGARSGLVERYLVSRDVSRAEFAPRLALRCLSLLQRDVSVTGDHDAHAREAMLDVLRRALNTLPRDWREASQ